MNCLINHRNPVFEFHISRFSRKKYDFDDSLFELNGNVVIANFHAARTFAQKMNAQRDLILHPEHTVKAGQINAMGLIDEILHLMIRQYQNLVNPKAMEQAQVWINNDVGSDDVEKTLKLFTDEFPPVRVYKQEIHLDDYLKGNSEGIPNSNIAIEELLMLWLANSNAAFSPYLELFDDRILAAYSGYPEIIQSLQDFFETQPPFGPNHETLINLLRAPALASPHSLEGQLRFIRENWSTMLGEHLQQLLSSLDFILEEEKPTFLGPGPSRVLQFPGPSLFEEERFSPDMHWMPRLVLLAKNAYVWLDQLSKEYQRPITSLDQVPDNELDKLAQWGFTGLWLIGLWERSSASQRIKLKCGNPDAVASAYSLYDFVIANRLGGEAAFENLKQRSWERGIRLAADMVPNHVGIYSKWVLEHPEWFLSLDYSPFPSYRFKGEDLSEDGRVGIYLEDHYYSREDAAVVFKRVDHWTGDEKYIYHGNDGTSMPWNDTAQLNFLNPEVREAVIQTIIHVARKFSVIRFDAAMTLAKKHFQRLWFPQPGSGGDIPSRSDFGMPQEQFDHAMPIEFWREVVDRVAQEAPDTLLLAEAFWMMEGYFVRTLGMHRVYNSAFMNMLRDEKNAQYRQLIKNTLEFDPEILKRYVNFMNNPDEETAIDQFGKDDKYFGICTMMVTMPGLPMFGHGQVEGFHEKYGMEYYRAYWDEQPDSYLIQRHAWEIFPLLHRRYLFADVANFFLYDFYNEGGQVDENVYAYTNLIGEPGTGHCQRSLVIYHNKWADVSGWIKTSAAYRDKASLDERLIQTNLVDGLGLRNDETSYTIFKDHVTGLEFIRRNRDLFDHGLYFMLGAYKYQVLMDFRQVYDNEWRQYFRVTEFLNGQGVPSIEETLNELILQPIHSPFKELVNPGFFKWLINNRSTAGQSPPSTVDEALGETETKLMELYSGISEVTEYKIEVDPIVQVICSEIRAILDITRLQEQYPLPRSRKYKSAYNLIVRGLNGIQFLDEGDFLGWGILFSYIFTHRLGEAQVRENDPGFSRHLLDDWKLDKIIAETLQKMGSDDAIAWEAVLCIKVLINNQLWYLDRTPVRGRTRRILEAWSQDEEMRRFLKINTYDGITWFSKEAMETICRWMFTIGTVDILINEESFELKQPDLNIPKAIVDLYDVVNKILKSSAKAEYQIKKLIDLV